MPSLRWAWAASALLFLGGCLNAGLRSYQETAVAQGLAPIEILGDGFNHRVYLNAAARSGAGPLHLYIDGDGIPWRGPGRPAMQPTGRNPLVLRLMALDPAPAAYLGRPCYLDAYDPAVCHPWHWTHGRYGEAVVASMVAATSHLAEDLGRHELVLIGYSGGGTLAMLMAARLPGVQAVATLGANLDLDAWVETHGYSPLRGSLDPATQPALPGRIAQWHWVGSADTEVPPAVVESGLRHQPTAHLEILDGIDHRCCWEQAWPGLLGRLTDAGPAAR